ncbi:MULTISPECIES: roadblock/LC7 domain-containing protein [unclassified Streptomyces]|uniref:roadblock/LC7 domain-containing protein n=1 Tax=unclassified Streptomyces TaxID=2593676 RepID=UPI002033596A|nr:MULTISPECIES: roadblock/LC7 domain-containing protein [unclassified Streptomyces]MCM2422969.1 roadblock/LC7 domain-containing protein [Streptomyces sp. RKAG293]MCM2424801.1 roadblock/LC7 domain-containing protein [Streptomyces sp. RKAG337]
MVSDVPPGRDLAWLLTDLVSRVPHTRSAVLLSSDGLKKAVHGLDGDSADHLAAVASGLRSLAGSAGARLGGGPHVRQVVAELEDALLFVSAAGSGSALAVMAGRDADPGVLGYEMNRLIQQVRPNLETPARAASAVTGDVVR